MKSEQIKLFDKIWAQAQEAANKAVQEQFPFNEKPTFRNEGPCGFAWIAIGGRGNFAKYAKETLGAHKNYAGKGFNIWYSNCYDSKGSQSYERHSIACDAAANVLRANDIKCHVSGRYD